MGKQLHQTPNVVNQIHLVDLDLRPRDTDRMDEMTAHLRPGAKHMLDPRATLGFGPLRGFLCIRQRRATCPLFADLTFNENQALA